MIFCQISFSKKEIALNTKCYIACKHGLVKKKIKMDISKVIQQHKRLCSLVAEKKIKQSLDILTDMISNSSSGDMRDEYNNIEMTYRNMLTYTIDGIKDPERNKVYLKLIQSILSLSDKARQDIL